MELAEADTIRAAAVAAGQGHLFDGWDGLSPADQRALLAEIRDLDFAYLKRLFEASTSGATQPSASVSPCNEVQEISAISPEQRTAWVRAGYELIASGRAGVLLLAGGQGTRLGSSAPKGCYDIGLPGGKSLFALQAQRLVRLQQLAAEALHGRGARVRRRMHWYIMTSDFTHEETVAHFKQHGYFSLSPSQVGRCAPVSVPPGSLPTRQRSAQRLGSNTPSHPVGGGARESQAAICVRRVHG